MSYRPVTLADVARSAGVSQAAASVALSNRRNRNIRISDETREKILEAAAKLGYVPNQNARHLKSGKNRIISVFTYEDMFPIDSMNEFHSFFNGIQMAAAENGYDLLIVNNRPFGRVTASAGSIMIGLERNDRDIAALSRRNYPIVFVGRREIDGVDADYVTFDYRNAIAAFVKEAAHASADSSLVFLSGIGDAFEPSLDKNRFLLEECTAAALRLSAFEDTNREAFRKAVLSSRVVFLNRIHQIPSFKAWCEGEGLVIGKDLKALVLEDDWAGAFPDWTRWENCRQALGSLAVKELIHRLEETEEEVEKLIPLPLIWSSSFPLS